MEVQLPLWRLRDAKQDFFFVVEKKNVFDTMATNQRKDSVPFMGW